MSRIAGNLKERALAFGIEAVRIGDLFPANTSGWVVGKQFLRAATSIGANVWEADVAHTDAEFANKMSIARKEANEVLYWIELGKRSGLISPEVWRPLADEAEQLVNILSTIVRKTQEHLRHG